MFKKLTIVVFIFSTMVLPVYSDESGGSLELQLWNDVKNSRNPEYLKSYIEKFPDGTFSELAKAKLRELEGPGENKSVEMLESGTALSNQRAEPTKTRNEKFFYQTKFQDNDWEVGDSNVVSAQVTTNGYRLESKRAVGFFAVWSHLDEVGADQFNLMDVDFDIYAKIKLVSYKGKGGFSGIVWGNDDTLENYNFAGVSPHGKQVVNAVRGGVVTSPNRWQSSSAINRSKGVFNRTSPTNELKISVRGTRYQFYINGEMVRDGAYPRHLVKDNFGFYVSQLATILVEDLYLRILE